MTKSALDLRIPDAVALIEDNSADIGNRGLAGIGGWLILGAINLAAGPILLIASILIGLDFLGDAIAFNPRTAILLVAEAIANTILLIAAIRLNVLFYRKRRQFPRWMIAYVIAAFLVALGDCIWATILGPSISWLGVLPSSIQMLIWIPYLLQSRRVEQTFGM